MPGVIRNPADARQVALAVAGPFVLIFPFFVSANVIIEGVLWLATWTFVCRHNYILHNHVHCPFTRSRPLNRLLGGMLLHRHDHGKLEDNACAWSPYRTQTEPSASPSTRQIADGRR